MARSAGLALALALFAAPAFAGQAFDRTVTMGDSLSDPGNVFVATGELRGPSVRGDPDQRPI